MLSRLFTPFVSSVILVVAAIGCSNQSQSSPSGDPTTRSASAAPQPAEVQTGAQSSPDRPAVSAVSATSLFDNVVAPPPAEGTPPAPETPSPESINAKKLSTSTTQPSAPNAVR